MKSECITFKGIEFRRYPGSKDRAHRVYYRPHATHIRNGVGHLHQEIWKDAYGDIPEGCDIHHSDLNPLNNDISNLMCLTSKAHHRVHDKAWLAIPENKKARDAHMEKIRKLASEWHGSEEGLRWHSEHAKEGWANRKQHELKCKTCEKTFKSKIPTAEFCSDKCSGRSRRKTLNEVKKCTVCGKEFKTYKGGKRKTCSPECRTKQILKTKGQSKDAKALV